MSRNNIIVISVVLLLFFIITGMVLYRPDDSEYQDNVATMHQALPVKNITQKMQHGEVVVREIAVEKIAPKEDVATCSNNLEPGEIPGNLREVCGITGDANLNTRLRALRKLGTQLTAGKSDVLSKLLESKYRSFSLNNSQEYVLVNEVLELLGMQSTDTFDFGHFAGRVISNADEDEVVRDYAVQHLGIWYAAQPHNENIDNIFWKALEIKNAAIAGTSLLALHRLINIHPQIDAARLADAASSIIRNDTCGSASKVTALRICAAMNAPGTLEYASNVVHNENSLPLRLSAVAALGELGDVGAGKLLQELINNSGDLQIKAAVEAALKKLSQKREK